MYPVHPLNLEISELAKKKGKRKDLLTLQDVYELFRLTKRHFNEAEINQITVELEEGEEKTITPFEVFYSEIDCLVNTLRKKKQETRWIEIEGFGKNRTTTF